ncbi:hypothetical protein ACP70R_024746 [Stipagrostis hirtigluma subsp. patula]
MEPSRGYLLLLLLCLLSAAGLAGAQPPEWGRCRAWDPCGPAELARNLAASCAGNDEANPTERCCQLVVAAVGIAFGDDVMVPCICRVAKEPCLLAAGLDVYSILRMYTPCHGVLPAGPYVARMCKAWF